MPRKGTYGARAPHRRLPRRLLVGLILPLLLAGLVTLGVPAGAQAAPRGGGRIGGGGFAPRAIPRSSYGGGGGGGSLYNRGFGGGGFGFPFILPFFGFGGGGLFGLLIFMAIAGVVVNGLRGAIGGGATDGNSRTAAPVRVQSDGPVTIAQLQLGLLAGARTLQQDLRQLAAAADTSSSTGLQRLLQDTTLSLMRNPEYWLYANAEQGQVPFGAAEATFNRLSIEERSKLDSETTVNVGGSRRSGGGGSSGASDCIAVTLLLASRSKLDLGTISSGEELAKALRLMGSVPSSDLLSLEVIWQPDAEGGVLSSDTLLTLYPQLQHL
ncbi:MAG: DUF1517 domain-containing protein [Aphanocapsa feldmannii 277cV]|uniref:DUF1517 domain-containing protein n=1 Tax=Aphanocapsa feldmannii 277cV TaxID=2507553 RepID=A0A524RR56_9CHRO|nr:MAG: DUF1517 domain-containing protein [Aphanocapsa feldmannii 277cV]